VDLIIYTHDQAIINVTTNITYDIEGDEFLLPGEVVRVEPDIRNIGELEATNLTLTENFGDFEVVFRDLVMPGSLCPAGDIKPEYDLRAPENLREDTNYTLYLEFTYSDYNHQLGEWKNHSKTLPIKILVKPTKLTILKDPGNYTLLNVGREVTVFNTVKNVGNRTAFNVNIIDTPPADFEVVSGQPSQSLGRLYPEDERTRSYTVISNDPIYCLSSSKTTYNDELNNNYTEFSNRVATRFSPFVTISKFIFDVPISPNISFSGFAKTRQSMRSDYSYILNASVEFTADAILKTFEGIPYYAVCQGTFLNGTPQLCIDPEGDEPKILINKTSEMLVEITNMGNTIARDVVARERFFNVNHTGEISWRGDLLPGETAVYNYLARPVNRRFDITTDVVYQDISPLSLITSDIVGYSVGVCTKKLENVSFTSSANFTVTYSDLKIDQEEVLRVFENSPFDFYPVVFNNGTEKIYNVWATLDFGGLSQIKGQRTIKIGDIDRGGFVPFQDTATCDLNDFHNINITKKYRTFNYLPSPRSNEVIYEIKDGVLRVYDNGVLVSHELDCEDDGLKITHDVTATTRYPFHVPPEPEFTTQAREEVSFKLYGNPVGLKLAFQTPSAENQTVIPLTTTVSYEDFEGNSFQRRFTTSVFVYPSTATFQIVRIERTDLGLVINYTNLTDPGEPGQLNMLLSSKGFGPIEKYVLNLTLPRGIEVSTNDTNWTGRIEAQIKRVNDTLFVFSGEISRQGNISRFGEERLPLVIRGVVPGLYAIPYKIAYDGKELSGKFTFKVRGPVIEPKKSLSKTLVDSGEEITVSLNIKNTGDGDALNVSVLDKVPGTIQVTSGSNRLTLGLLTPGEEANLTYNIKATASVDMGSTTINWKDSFENEFTHENEPVTLTVKVPTPAPTEPPATTAPPPVETPQPTLGPGKIIPEEVPEEPGGVLLTSQEGIAIMALVLVVILIVLKLLTIKLPAKEKESK
jgi:uncharacterized repeat protein (TIGR01451 family)